MYYVLEEEAPGHDHAPALALVVISLSMSRIKSMIKNKTGQTFWSAPFLQKGERQIASSRQREDDLLPAAVQDDEESDYYRIFKLESTAATSSTLFAICSAR